MSDISKLTIGGETFDLKDATARKLGSADNPIRIPLYIEKDGIRYVCDIADDADGIDWILKRVVTRA